MNSIFVEIYKPPIKLKLKQLNSLNVEANYYSSQYVPVWQWPNGSDLWKSALIRAKCLKVIKGTELSNLMASVGTYVYKL